MEALKSRFRRLISAVVLRRDVWDPRGEGATNKSIRTLLECPDPRHYWREQGREGGTCSTHLSMPSVNNALLTGAKAKEAAEKVFFQTHCILQGLKPNTF